MNEIEIDTIKGIQFGLWSPEEIERRSVCEILTHETYDGDTPKMNGLFDPRMGTLDHDKICPTDEQSNNNCPGYFGHIRLPVAVFNVQFLKYIISILKCTCLRCSNILEKRIDDDTTQCIYNKEILLTKKGIHRWLYFFECMKKETNKICPNCSAISPKSIKRDTYSLAKLIINWDKKHMAQIKAPDNICGVLNPDDVLKIFKRFTTEQIITMGFNPIFSRPEWLICTILPVAPPAVRPFVKQDGNVRMEDDLTHKYCDIIKTVRSLKQKIDSNAPQNLIDEWTMLLQYHIATLVDNNIKGVPQAIQRSGRPLKSIKERLKAKEGRVRGNLMGKRVDFSSRSVITPDPNIDIDQLGVPKIIAKNLTKPDIVNKYNIDFLKLLVKNGKNWPGAKQVYKTKEKKTYNISFTNRINIEIGDVVHRHLLDDDWVLFNRQPSLHKMSMMAHRVKVMDGKTFRLNLCVTSPYNADFDKLLCRKQET